MKPRITIPKMTFEQLLDKVEEMYKTYLEWELSHDYEYEACWNDLELTFKGCSFVDYVTGIICGYRNWNFSEMPYYKGIAKEIAARARELRGKIDFEDAEKIIEGHWDQAILDEWVEEIDYDLREEASLKETENWLAQPWR